MCPICFKIGFLTVHWYGVMLAAGFVSGLATWIWLGRSKGWDFSFCSDLLFWIMFSGIAGARIAYVLANFEEYIAEPIRIIRLDQGGLVYYGGFIGAAIAVVVFSIRRNISPLRLGDFVVTALPLGHALGRVGCFLNGCCFGKVAPKGWPFAVSYPRDSNPWYWQWRNGMLADNYESGSLPVHPVQLYETFFNLVIYLILIAVYRRNLKEGRVSAIYFLLYPAGRFALEFFRGDARMRFYGMTIAQLTSIALFLAGIVLWRISSAAKNNAKENTVGAV